MIRKFTAIKNLAVFQNFDWDTTVREIDGSLKLFSDVNIIYGRNYSGKTTLSRILRALEIGRISDKYENPEFTLSVKDESDIVYPSSIDNSKMFRVFNEDFIRENLKFIYNSDEDIESFAVLGEDNPRLIEEIEHLQKEVGSNVDGEETGYYKSLKELRNKKETDQKNYDREKKTLDEQLRYKATDREKGIKYNSEKFGDQNYDIRNLNSDIETVSKNEFQAISDDEKKELEKLIEEDTLSSVREIDVPNFNYKSYSKLTEELLGKKVLESGKIEELVNDVMLNNWVKQGKKLHKGKRDFCGFCGNKISEKRWSDLEKHFDEESDKLENSIDSLIDNIHKEKKKIELSFQPDKDNFYSKFQEDVENLKTEFEEVSANYNESLDKLIEQLEERKLNLINTLSYSKPEDYTQELDDVFAKFEKIRTKTNSFSNSLEKEQKKAKKILRLREISDFIDTIKYSEKLSQLEDLEAEKNASVEEFEKQLAIVEQKESLILAKKRELNDEENGAKKVNEYLNNFFGHNFLSLEAIEKKDDEDEKSIRFQVIREGKTAYHLSEGESNLIAFCYFVAKLDDISTKGKKPIIWIDDPVSSLDGNHIFFVYSLIKAEIVDKEKFEQLFLSTHNLGFLKYLKRLYSGENAYFIINRQDKTSSLLPMPKYLKKYFTEFNYLFEQIYKCSKIDKVDDTNYTVFYNFGNNARKFLEIYLYYKYPDSSSDSDKLKKFFGEENIPSILTDRINNEYSHLSGVFERGSTPVEVPEMRSVAAQIINKLKEDKEQFSSLLKSIGVEKLEENVA